MRTKTLAFMVLLVLITGFITAQEDYSYSIDTVNSSCHSGEELGVINHQVQTDSNERNISFEGVIQTSNPCYFAEAEVEQVKEGVYEYNVVPQSEEGICVECVGYIEYNAEFSKDDDYEIRVLHDGEFEETFKVEENQNETASKGFFERFSSWFTGLFGR